MNNRILQFQANIAPLKSEIVNHKVYASIRDLDDLQTFMQYHVFAVWDFMSLLKSLQNSLTCTTIPWIPVGSGDARFLINEIVVGEESDVDPDGKRISHFELYLNAMKQCGASTQQIEAFLRNLKEEADLNAALTKSNVPTEAADFVNFTFKVIETQRSHLQSAVFTFGREDLIPDMFHSIVNDIHTNFPEKVSIFKYYLERHIEIDGDHHSHLALEMTSRLCGENEEFWKEAENVTMEALRMRIALWDGVYNKITNKVLS